MLPGMSVIPLASVGLRFGWSPGGYYDTVDRTIYTFSSLPLTSSASSARRVVACIAGFTGTSVLGSDPSVTIGGVSATLHTGPVDGIGSTKHHSYIFSAVVPTGTTATVVVTWNRTMSVCGVELFEIYGVDTVADTVWSTTGTSPVSHTSVTTGAFTEEVVITCASGISGSSGASVSYTNATKPGAGDAVGLYNGTDFGFYDFAYADENLSSATVTATWNVSMTSTAFRMVRFIRA